MEQLIKSNVESNKYSSVWQKYALCFLFLGFAYCLFSSSLINLGNTTLPHFAPEPPPENSHDDLSKSLDNNLTLEKEIPATEKVNLFVGDWIHDPNGPFYTNTTCKTIEAPQNCLKNGRMDTDFLYWRWKPRGFDLPRFDPNKFLHKMRSKSLAFIGDSIMRNHVQSLLCMLSQVEEAVEIYHDKTYKSKKWSFPSHNFTVSVIWSPFLTRARIFEDDDGVSTDIIELHPDEPDTVWTDQYGSLDYVVIGGGKWFLKSAIYYENNSLIGCHNCHEHEHKHDTNITQVGFPYAYRKALGSVLEFINSSRKRPLVTLFRTSAPDHFESSEWNNGGYCNRTRPYKRGEIGINELDRIMRMVELEEFERAAAVGKNLKLLDTTLLSLLRPDGHPGVYRKLHPYEGKNEDAKIQNDCLHWCLPGPIDSWNDLMMELLLNDSN